MPEIKNVYIDQITQELHKAFHLFNKHYFNNVLPTPAITIQSSGHKRNSMGWCTVVPVWGDKSGKIKMYEINLSAEFLDLDFFETMDTLLHEMVHLYHKVNGIQDCSRKGTYHNKHFKKKVLEIGFEYTNDKPDPKHGWTYARLGQKAKDEISSMGINADLFTISRRGSSYFTAIENGESPEEVQIQSARETASSGKPSSYKWVCPNCGLIMRSTKQEVHVICGECNQKLEKDP